MSTARTPRSLADDLRARDDAGLAALLRARPDLATPAPGDSSSLAARASTRASVQRAVDRLDTPSLQLLEVVAALGEPVTVREVSAACGEPQRVVTPLLRRLKDAALVWGPDRALRAVRAVDEVLGPHPAGLGPPLRDVLATRPASRVAALAEDLGVAPDRTRDVEAVVTAVADAEALVTLLSRAPAGARDVVDRLAAGPPVGSVEDAEREVRASGATSPVEWLLAHGLLVPIGRDRVVLPREVGIAARGGRIRDGLDVQPPPLVTASTRRPEQVDAAAAGQASEAVRLTEQLAESWSVLPAPVLRAGGLGVRQLRRVADDLDVDVDHAAFVVELAWAAGLVAEDGEAGPAWMPTPEYDTWREDTIARRWAVLVAAWLATSRVPGLVGTRDGRGSIRNALAADLDRPSVVAIRRDVLGELAAAGPGDVATPDSLDARLRWRSPRRTGSLSAQLAMWTVREAGWLGVTGLGAMSTAGRALVEAPDAAVAGEVLDTLVPEPVDHVLLQADLTAVAPGPLTPSLARDLALLAEVDSRGGATVYRFTPGSVRRGLDAGRTAQEVLALLARSSRTPVPQPLEYLVSDVARRHGRLRVGSASAYVRADDEHLLAEVLADRRTAVLRLRRLAPTVLAAQADPGAVLDTLREVGLAPAMESPEGDVVVRRADAHRTRPRPRPRPVTFDPPPPTEHLTAAVIAAVRAGDGAAADRARHETRGADVPPIPTLDPATSLAALRQAAADRQAVWVGVADPGGGTTRRRVEPLAVDGGRVTVLDTGAGHVRTLSVHRIIGVGPVA